MMIKIKKYTVAYECNLCNQIVMKPWGEFLKYPNCYFCNTKQKLNTKSYQAILPQEYTLLSEYKGQEEKVLIKHKCGFIWKIRPHLLISYVGCPKCNKKRSKGEQKIGNFLDKNNIVYSIEESFSWQSNTKRRYDFYLPEENMVIEYMGEQHFRDTHGFFGTNLEEQQKIDKEKKNEAINNGLKYLAISYKDYNHIEEILLEIFGSTTIDVEVSTSKE